MTYTDTNFVALLAVVHANPFDVVARAVLADYLSEKDHGEAERWLRYLEMKLPEQYTKKTWRWYANKGWMIEPCWVLLPQLFCRLSSRTMQDVYVSTGHLEKYCFYLSKKKAMLTAINAALSFVVQS